MDRIPKRDSGKKDNTDNNDGGEITESNLSSSCENSSLSSTAEGDKGLSKILHAGSQKQPVDGSRSLAKRGKKFWNFLSKKRPSDDNRCDPDRAVEDDYGNDQPESTILCLCTGLRRSQVRNKVVQEFPPPAPAAGELSGVDALAGSSCDQQGGAGVVPTLVGAIPTSENSPPHDDSTTDFLVMTRSALSAIHRGVASNDGATPEDEVIRRILVPKISGSSVEFMLTPCPQPFYNGSGSGLAFDLPASTSNTSCNHPRWMVSSATMVAAPAALLAASLDPNEEDVFLDSTSGEFKRNTSFIPRTIHTQVDYIHCLVPDLMRITGCSYYWGVMDRYEAERLLENRPEGTFLLRDSAQEEFLFSVSFRRYSRSLHARVEQWNHKFSFDSHDSSVYASTNVCGLIEHYKDPACCMFFEPMLTLPLVRSNPFSLQQLCRSAICSMTTYDGISYLPLPKPLHQFLQYYHYKQKVRVRRFETLPAA